MPAQAQTAVWRRVRRLFKTHNTSGDLCVSRLLCFSIVRMSIVHTDLSFEKCTSFAVRRCELKAPRGLPPPWGDAGHRPLWHRLLAFYFAPKERRPAGLTLAKFFEKEDGHYKWAAFLVMESVRQVWRSGRQVARPSANCRLATGAALI